MKKTISLNPSATGYIVDIEVPDPVISHTVIEKPDTGGGINKPPVANAGTDKTIILPVNSVFLDASSSFDPEGKIKAYIWRKASGPDCLIKNPSLPITEVVNMREGIYQFELRVVDDKNNFSADTVFVNVKKEVVQPPINVPPSAKAGNDQTITLPVNKINLDGSLSVDPDGQIKSYKWIKVSGPACKLVNDLTAVLTVEEMIEGSYIFRLTITDNQDASNSDDVTITVKPAVVVPPLPTTTFPFTLTKDTTWRKRNFAGYENWNGQNYAPFGATWSDYYFRFVVCDFVKGSNATLDWTRFDNEIRKAITNKAKFSFAVFSVNDSDNFLALENYGGASSRYPLAWHNQMQSESVKDFTRNGMWIPNWNSTSFLNNFENLLKQIANRIETQSFNGVRYEDVINYVDIREYGQWGEWHNGGLFDNMSQYPAGTRPTVASYKRFIDSHINAFPNFPLVCLFAAYDANWLPHTLTPPEVTNYVLTAKNNWGYIGWRRDQWGQTDNYIADYLQNNTRSFGNSGPFNAIIMERWKVAPVVGEPYGPGANLSDLARQATYYHATSIGNGNYTDGNSTSEAQFKDAEDKAGYKYSFISGNLKTTKELDFDISINVENFGGGVCFEDYTLVYELKNAAGNVIWTANSPWDAKRKVPGTHVIDDHFKMSTPLAAGNYSLLACFKSSADYRRMPLYNKEERADKYILLTDKINIANT